MRVEDVRDLFAHIKTLPAVQGKVRDHDVPFPFNVRRTLGGWKFLFLDGKPFQPDASEAAQWNRGAYLVNGPGHCAECHSPRNPLGGIVEAQRFAGGPNPEGEGWVPNITQKALGDYSDKDIAYLLETGNTPDGDSVGGAMTRGGPQHLAASAPRTATRWRPTSSRCRRSKDRRSRRRNSQSHASVARIRHRRCRTAGCVSMPAASSSARPASTR